jgi:hypothetical protein
MTTDSISILTRSLKELIQFDKEDVFDEDKYLDGTPEYDELIVGMGFKIIDNLCKAQNFNKFAEVIATDEMLNWYGRISDFDKEKRIKFFVMSKLMSFADTAQCIESFKVMDKAWFVNLNGLQVKEIIKSCFQKNMCKKSAFARALLGCMENKNYEDWNHCLSGLGIDINKIKIIDKKWETRNVLFLEKAVQAGCSVEVFQKLIGKEISDEDEIISLIAVKNRMDLMKYIFEGRISKTLNSLKDIKATSCEDIKRKFKILEVGIIYKDVYQANQQIELAWKDGFAKFVAECLDKDELNNDAALLKSAKFGRREIKNLLIEAIQNHALYLSVSVSNKNIGKPFSL